LFVIKKNKQRLTWQRHFQCSIYQQDCNHVLSAGTTAEAPALSVKQLAEDGAKSALYGRKA